MRQDRPVEWTSENVTAFWDFELKFPDRYFTYHNADGMIKRLGKYIAQSEAILDYGCGTGLLLARLAEQGHRVAGSDTSEQSLEATRHRLQGYDTFLGAFTPDALLAEGRQFDTILAVELVEHLHDDWLDHALGNLRGLLEPNGRIIVTTPNQERLENSLLRCPYCRTVFHRWQHVRAWSQASLTDYVEQRGFRSPTPSPPTSRSSRRPRKNGRSSHAGRGSRGRSRAGFRRRSHPPRKGLISRSSSRS